MLATLLRPDQGDAFVMGHSIRKNARSARSLRCRSTGDRPV
jgi:ABC-type multidrug transport system ATPase subunit